MHLTMALHADNKHVENNTSSSRAVPQKPAPYAMTHKKDSIKLPAKDTAFQTPQHKSENENVANVVEEKEYEIVSLLNQPLTGKSFC